MIYGLFMWIVLVGLGTMALVNGATIVGITCFVAGTVIWVYTLKSRK